MTPARSVIRVLLTIGLMSVLVCLGKPKPAAAAGPCGVEGAAIIRSSPHAVLVRRGRGYRHYWACLRSNDRPVHVGIAGSRPSEPDEYFLEKFAFGGRFFAALSYGCLEGCAGERVELYDLRARRRVRTIDMHGVEKVLVGTGGGVGLVHDRPVPVDIDPNAEGPLPAPTYLRSITAWDSRGMTRVTQSRRRELPLASVRIRGNLLRWRQAGAEDSFRMRALR
jgi:hypothetical protein